MIRGGAIRRGKSLIWAAALVSAACEPTDRQRSSSGPEPSAAPARAPTPAGSASAAAIGVPSAPEPGASSGPGAPDAGRTVSAPAKDSRLVVLLGGDVNFGRGVGKRMRAEFEYDPFRGVGKWFSASDVVFVNLESPLVDASERQRSAYAAPPVGAGILSRSGVTVVSVANHRAWSNAEDGFRATLDSLRNAGVAYAGGSDEPDGQYSPRLLRVKGFKIAVFAVTDIWSGGSSKEKRRLAITDFARLEPELVRARAENDVVLLSYDGGREYAEDPSADAIAFARRAMKLGVDAVAGHHPQVPEGVAWFNGKPVFYSLGNLVSGVMRDHPGTAWGFLGKLVYDHERNVVVSACPYHVDAHSLPEAAERPEAEARALEILVASSRVGGTKTDAPDADGCVPLAPPR